MRRRGRDQGLPSATRARDVRYTDTHAEFCLLFERKIEGVLDGEAAASARRLPGADARERAGAGYSTAEFWQKLTKAVDDDAPLEGAGFMLECLRAATDYVQFATTMRLMRRNSGK